MRPKNEFQMSFWKLVSNDRFPKLKDVKLKIFSMFISTSVYESTFSVMRLVKSKYKNHKADKTLSNCLQLATTYISVSEQAISVREASTAGIPLTLAINPCFSLQWRPPPPLALPLHWREHITELGKASAGVKDIARQSLVVAWRVFRVIDHPRNLRKT